MKPQIFSSPKQAVRQILMVVGVALFIVVAATGMRQVSDRRYVEGKRLQHVSAQSEKVSGLLFEANGNLGGVPQLNDAPHQSQKLPQSQAAAADTSVNQVDQDAHRPAKVEHVTDSLHNSGDVKLSTLKLPAGEGLSPARQ
ncbi:MAG: hypothetical protein NVS1B7_0440 [Candidatus Saccharimonadales bacterium]